MKRLVTTLAAAGVLAAASGAMATAIPFEYNTRPVTPILNTQGQASLQEVINSVVGADKIDAIADQSKVGAWTTSEGKVDAYRVTLLSPMLTGKFGIFSLGTGAQYDLLTATPASSGDGGYDTGFRISKNTTTGNYYLKIGSKIVDSNFGRAFGFYWYDKNGSTAYTSYTLDTMNDGGAGALAYLVPNNTQVTLKPDSNSEDSWTATGDNDWIVAFDNGADIKIPGSGNPGNYETADFNDAVFYVEDMNPVPEPGTMMLLGAGFLGLAIYGKRRKNA